MTTKQTYSMSRLLPAETLLYAPNRKYPPYGKRVAGILDNPALLCRFVGCTPSRASIWITTDWDWPGCHPNHLPIVIPVTDDPGDYQWHFLHGHEPILLNNINPPFAEQIATAMIRDGVTTVVTVNNESTIYRKQQHDH